MIEIPCVKGMGCGVMQTKYDEHLGHLTVYRFDIYICVYIFMMNTNEMPYNTKRYAMDFLTCTGDLSFKAV